MEIVSVKVELGQFLIRHFDSFGIGPGIQLGMDFETGRRGSSRNQIDNYLDAHERLASPVLGDARKETMLDFVPLAGARWEVTDRNG